LASYGQKKSNHKKRRQPQSAEEIGKFTKNYAKNKKEFEKRQEQWSSSNRPRWRLKRDGTPQNADNTSTETSSTTTDKMDVLEKEREEGDEAAEEREPPKSVEDESEEPEQKQEKKAVERKDEDPEDGARDVQQDVQTPAPSSSDCQQQIHPACTSTLLLKILSFRILVGINF
jgi:hypothetical protein